MPDTKTEWLTAREAAKVLTSKSDFEITDAYVRRLARDQKLEIWPINPHMYLYSRASVESYRFKRKGQPQRV